jgi:hypothetical protein
MAPRLADHGRRIAARAFHPNAASMHAPRAQEGPSGARHAARPPGASEFARAGPLLRNSPRIRPNGPVVVSNRSLFGASGPRPPAGGGGRQDGVIARASRSNDSARARGQSRGRQARRRLGRSLSRASAANPPRSATCARVRVDELQKACSECTGIGSVFLGAVVHGVELGAVGAGARSTSTGSWCRTTSHVALGNGLEAAWSHRAPRGAQRSSIGPGSKNPLQIDNGDVLAPGSSPFRLSS